MCETSVGVRNLAQFLQRHTSQQDLIIQAMARLKKGETAGAILSEFREAGHDGNWAIAYWRNPSFSGRIAKMNYDHSQTALLDQAAEAQRHGIFRAWLLWERDPASGEWSERGWFPDEAE
jgi:hypothetical protein